MLFRSSALADEAMEGIEGSNLDKEEKTVFNKIKKGFSLVKEKSIEILKLVRLTEKGFLAPEINKLVEEVDEAALVVIEGIEGLHDQVDKKSLEARQEAERVKRLGIQTTVIISIVGILFGLIAAFLFTRNITKQVGSLVTATRKMAEGDLTVKAIVTTQDEIGELAVSFNQMTEDLQKITVSRDYVDNIVKSMINTLIVVEPDATIQIVNAATCELLGYDENELIGEQIGKIFAEEELLFKSTGLKDLIKKGFIQNVEKTYLSKDGRKIPVLFSCSVMHAPFDSKDQTGKYRNSKIQGIVCVAQDITERKLAEQTLRESEEKFRGVIEQSNDGLYVLQEDRFVFINPRYTEITGFELDEISAEDFDFKELITEEGLKVLEERGAMRKRGENVPGRYVFKGLRKDGQKRDLEVSVTIVEWQGAPATLGVLHDVTDRIQIRTELQKALEDAKQANSVKSLDRKSTRLNSSHIPLSRMPSSA